MASSTTTAAAADSPPSKASGSLTPGTQIVAASADAQVVEDASDDVPVRSDEAAPDGSFSSCKKPVWNKPSNEAIEVEPVMGADSWPALSEIAKGPQKSSAESNKSAPEASSLPFLQGTTGPARNTHKQVTSNPHPNSSQNYAHPARQKSFKRHGGNASGNNGSSIQPQPPLTLPHSASVISNHNTSSSHKNFDLESVQKVASESQYHGTNDRTQHNNPHRRGNGPHHHGDNSYNHRYGARKDQDRPNREWNSQRSFSGRDVNPQATGSSPRGIIRHIPIPHGSAPYVTPPLSPNMRPYGPVTYPEFPFYYVPVQPESIRGMPIPYPAPTLHHMFVQYLDPELYSKVIHQIEYYFSNENLIKDTYLRRNMDEQGWVPIKLIAGFKKVMKLTDNIAFIMEAIRTSTVVEVKDDKVRRRNDWMKWLMPESVNFPSQSTYLDPGSSSDFVARIQKIKIDGESSDIPSTTPQFGVPLLHYPPSY